MYIKNKTVLLTIITILSLSGHTNLSYAASIKDSDLDGLSDESEVTIYRTDPVDSDTDQDSFSDLQEVLNRADPVDASDTPQKVTDITKIQLLNVDDPLIWYVSRISGIVAFILITFVVAFGLIQTSRALVRIRIMGFLTAQEIHRIIAWSAIIVSILHVGSLMFDKYFSVSLQEVLVPFTLYRDFKSVMGFDFNLTVSLGVIALYTMFILVITSELRKKVVSMKVWRVIHYISFAGYILLIAHGFLSGSDSKEPWMRAIYIFSLILVLTLLMAKVFKKRLFYRTPTKVSP